MKLFVSLSVLMLLAIPAFATDGQQLLKQIDRNMNPESYESYRKLINIEPDGTKKEFTLYTVKKGVDKVASLFLAPASDKGRTTLRLGDNMWLHIPNVGKPMRITSLQSVVGGVFNNADILQLDYDAEYKVEKVEEKGGEYLLHLKAKTKSVAYDRVRIFADKGRKLPVKIECLTEAGMLIKTLYFKDVKDFGGFSRPATVETDSPLYKGYKSVMLYAKVKKRSFKDEVFTLNAMTTLDSLR
jgi:outer membrane lipoprotein-sorting protein